jgi:hypothetical protein
VAQEAFSLVSQALEERPVWTLQQLLEERGAADGSAQAVEAALWRAAYTFQKGAASAIKVPARVRWRAALPLGCCSGGEAAAGMHTSCMVNAVPSDTAAAPHERCLCPIPFVRCHGVGTSTEACCPLAILDPRVFTAEQRHRLSGYSAQLTRPHWVPT